MAINPSVFDADAADDPKQNFKSDTSRRDGATNRPGSTPSPDTQKVSGSGPAIAEHSKDAKAPKGGRQPGAYVKD